MSAAKKRCETTGTTAVDRQAALERATARREKLQAMFDDASFVDLALRQGRYLRLCAAIAWASEREEAVRAALDTDRMVDQLRRIRSGDGALGAA